MRTVAALAVAVMLCTACGTPSAPSTSTASPSSSQAGETSAAPSGPAADACTLLTEEDLRSVFAAAIPQPQRRITGGGFADCFWASDAARVQVSLVPLPNLASDYVDQLNVGGTLPELAPAAVWFPGVVGIGMASGG